MPCFPPPLRLRPFRALGKRIIVWQIFYSFLIGAVIALIQLSLFFVYINAFHPSLLQEMGSAAFLVIACQFFGVIALSFLMARIYRHMVGHPLSLLAKQIDAYDPARLVSPLELPRRHRPWQDEFDQLMDAFKQLSIRLHRTLLRHEHLEQELQQHRDDLSKLVLQRTQTLERWQEFHTLVITLLTNCMNHPAGQAQMAVDQSLEAFCHFFSAQYCILFTLDESDRGLRIANAWPPIATDLGEPHILLARQSDDDECKAVRGSRIWISNATSAPSNAGDDVMPLANQQILLDDAPCTIVGVEILHRTTGLLCLVGESLDAQSDQAKFLELAAKVAANMLDHHVSQMSLLETQQVLERVNQDLNFLSSYDPLTNLANRRYFDEVKTLEFSRAIRGDLPLAVLMCDLDYFKFYNDTYGHAQGDLCLKQVAHCIAKLFTRAGEFPARLGGEEFAVILPGASAEQALVAAERLRLAIWERNIAHKGSPLADRVTMTIGAACLDPTRDTDFDRMLCAADQALYRAKLMRNCVCMDGDVNGTANG